MASYTVNIITKTTGNDDLQCKVTNWRQSAVVGDYVSFRSLPASDRTVVLKFAQPKGSPFVGGGDITVPRDTTQGPYQVATGKNGPYKYAVTGSFDDGETFAVDPRFIIGGMGAVPPVEDEEQAQ